MWGSPGQMGVTAGLNKSFGKAESARGYFVPLVKTKEIKTSLFIKILPWSGHSETKRGKGQSSDLRTPPHQCQNFPKSPTVTPLLLL